MRLLGGVGEKGVGIGPFASLAETSRTVGSPARIINSSFHDHRSSSSS
jgi:hypothetical protein